MTDGTEDSIPFGVQDHIALNEDTNLEAISDTTNGLLFVRMFRDTVRYAVDKKRWYLWNGRHWSEDTGENLGAFALTQSVIRYRRERALGAADNERDQLLQLITRLESEGKRRSMLAVARADPRIRCLTRDFDTVKHHLVVGNGTVDLRTGELRPGTPSDMNSLACIEDYLPEAAEPGYSDELELFLETFIPDEKCAVYVFKLLGHCLFVGNDLRLMPVFWGGTTSGKSQLFAALQRILGSYICAINPSVFRGNLDDKPRPDLVRAMMTRIAYAPEGSKSWALHADQIKRLSGGSDTLPYRDLFGSMLNEIPRFTAMIVANEFPRVNGIDPALKRRIISIHLDVTLPPEREDPAIRARFLDDKKVREALLARLIWGARQPLARDMSDVPEKYALATMAARAGMGHVDEFLEWAQAETVLLKVDETVAASGCVKSSELFTLYSHWLKKYGDEVDKRDRLGSKGFSQALMSLGWESKASAGTRWLGWRITDTMPFWMKMEL